MSHAGHSSGRGTLFLVGAVLIILAGLLVCGLVPLVECPQCYGSGQWGGVKGDPDVCSHCDGKGDVSLYMKYVRRPDKPPQRIYPYWERPRWFQH
jgi:hypothetical protein